MDFSLKNYSYFGYDTETTGLQYKKDKVFGFSISCPNGPSRYYDIREQPEAASWLNDELRYYNGKVVCHNAPFDYMMSHDIGIYLPIDGLDDTVTRAVLINEHEFAYELDHLAKKYIGREKTKEIWDELAEIFGGKATKNVQIKNLHRAPSELVATYAIPDAEIALALYEWQQAEIQKQGIQQIIEFERDLTPTIIRARMRGVRVDVSYAEEAADKISPIIEQKQAQLNQKAGVEVNVNSPPQVKKLFVPKQISDGSWVTADGTPLASTPSGNASLGADALRTISDPMAGLILEIRSLLKTRDTFLRKHVIEHAIDGRVYPSVNQNKGEDGGTGTGRLSYSGPALQQIPSRNKQIAEIVKQCFLPELGQVWADGDMASFEVRIFYHLINNARINELYRNDPEKDAHQFVADLTGLNRNATYSSEPNAKQLNLSMIFNSGNGAIADKMGMPWEWNSFVDRNGKKITYKKAGAEAEAIIAKYHREVVGVRKLAEGCKSVAESRGYIHTSLGRRLRFPKGYKSYKASGLLIQATSADKNKENWKIIEDVLGDEGHLILNTHDSYSMSLPEDWKPLYNKVKKEIERPDRARVPLVLDLNGVGRNWWSALQGELSK